ANSEAVKRWFSAYDRIRREAQMTPAERQDANELLAKPIRTLIVKKDKAAARTLLTRMVTRYQRAVGQMRQLPKVAQTQELSDGYAKYFSSAKSLFVDYLELQDRPLAKDEDSGKPVRCKL